MIEFFKTIVFGIVEGITEWLPISSTGHMMLLNQLWPLNVSDSFYDTFLVVIQLGAIAAVIVIYFNKLNPFSRKKTVAERRMTWDIWVKVIIGTIPAGIIGLMFDDLLEDKVMNNPSIAYIVVAVALLVYGVLFIILERVPNMCGALAPKAPAAGRHQKKTKAQELMAMGQTEACDGAIESFAQMSYFRALMIGIFQGLAVIPGTSRSGSIIIGSMLMGTSRTIAAEFAFFLAIPIMFGWSVVKLLKHGLGFTGTEWMILGVGMVVAFVVSIVVIRFLLAYIKKNDFTAFGIYRVVLAVVVLLYFGVIA